MYMSRFIRTFVLSALVAPAALLAQGNTGQISGVVTNASQAPIAGARITIVETAQTAFSNAEGRFTIINVAAGNHSLRVVSVGLQPKVVANVAVAAGATVTTNIALTEAVTNLGGVVVTASRRVEKITEAPATITSIDVRALDRSVGNTFVAALKEAKGLDFIQVGMTSVAINARGFNSSFNNRMLQVEDGRISVIPESGLPIGALTAIPKVDLAGMEVLVGPGSALYGADASNGVVAMISKDPRAFPGATIEITGGNRSYRDIQGRYAGTAGNFGYKVTGEFQDANDFENLLTYNAGGAIVPTGTAGAIREDNLRIPIDFTSRVVRGSGAVVYYRGDSRFEINAGMSQTDGVAQTSVGRNQLDGWKYNSMQAKYTAPHWYVNAYRTQSQSGKSFALNRYAGRQATSPSLTADSLRLLSDWPSNGQLLSAEVQGNYTVAPLLNTHFVFGVQARNDIVSSDRQWLNDRVTTKDISNKQTGVYAQSTSPLHRMLDLVLAGRYDNHELYDPQFSPKVGVVMKPAEDHAFRVTWNRAFKSPTILQTDFFIPDWTAAVAIFGNTGGFTVENGAGATVATYSPLQPEENKTWEFGYKGILRNRFFFDGTYFRSAYTNMLSPLSVIANPFTGATATFAKPAANPYGIPVNAAGFIVNPANARPVMLTYFNVGAATLSGVDMSANFRATRHIDLRGTLSTIAMSDVKVPAANVEATALNTTPTKWTVGATAHDIGPMTAGLTVRNVVGYYFRSGANTGVIPTFGTLDAHVSLRFPQFDRTMINLGLSNIAACTRTNVTYRPLPVPQTTPATPPNSQIASQEHKCGFNRKHREMINMPEIGPMAFLGVRIER